MFLKLDDEDTINLEHVVHIEFNVEGDHIITFTNESVFTFPADSPGGKRLYEFMQDFSV